MPQMNPMNWIILMIYFLILFKMFNIMMFFFFLKIKNKIKNYNINKTKFSFKW